MPIIGVEPPDIGAKVYHSANQESPHNTSTYLSFDSERFDTDTIHDLVTNNGHLTCRTAGKYILIAESAWVSNATGRRECLIVLNHATVIASNEVDTNQNAAHIHRTAIIYSLAVGDYVEVRVLQSSGGALNVYGGYDFMMQRIG